jgi:oligoendopeptidase F
MTKNKKNLSSKTKHNLPRWDLSDFYSSIEDKKIAADLEKIAKELKAFSAKYQGKITKLNAPGLAKAIADYEKISEEIANIASYSYLIYTSDLSNQKYLAFYQNISEKLSSYESELVFFTLELNEIEQKKLDLFLKNSAALKKYQSFIRDIRFFKKYQLSKELEKFSLEKNITGASGWVRLFDETVNNLKFTYQKKTLNYSEIFDLYCNKDEKIRKEAAKSIGKSLKENSKIFTYITNILAKDKEINDRFRGFKTPIQSRNLNNFVDDKIVETLVSTVKANYKDLSHRYYKIKAKMLGKKHLEYWDRNAPLDLKTEKITWNDAKEIVLEAYNQFCPEMSKIAEKFFDNSWIDAEVRDGKDGGAFSLSATPKTHPYILMNYQGKLRDVMTLAHELGHGVHQYLAAKQGFLISQTPLTLAETASVFGEQLTFQKILENQKNPAQKRLIIAAKVEDMLNTVIRQISFLEFEKQIHNARKNGEISLEQICQFWMQTQKESLGPIFKFDEEYQYFWSYIPHFIHSPFYVYSYAFGDCLVNSLYGIYKQQKVKNFTDKYLEMLKSGGSKHHKELLAPFNLDASDPKFWQSGLDVISGYIDML